MSDAAMPPTPRELADSKAVAVRQLLAASGVTNVNLVEFERLLADTLYVVITRERVYAAVCRQARYSSMN